MTVRPAATSPRGAPSRPRSRVIQSVASPSASPPAGRSRRGARRRGARPGASASSASRSSGSRRGGRPDEATVRPDAAERARRARVAARTLRPSTEIVAPRAGVRRRCRRTDRRGSVAAAAGARASAGPGPGRVERRPSTRARCRRPELDLVGADRRRRPVHLEHPAASGRRPEAPDLVDVRAERGGCDVVVELAREAGADVERLERVRGLDGRGAAPKIVCVLPSTRIVTVAASAATGASAATSARTTSERERRSTNPPSARGSTLAAGGRSSDSGRPPRRLPGRGQWRLARSISPHSGGTVPDSHRVPFPLAGLAATLSSPRALAPALTVWLPVVAWAAAIFALSSVPSSRPGSARGTLPAEARARDRVRGPGRAARAGAERRRRVRRRGRLRRHRRDPPALRAGGPGASARRRDRRSRASCSASCSCAASVR